MEKEAQKPQKTPPAPEQNAGSAVYSPFVLRFLYDFWVLRVSCSYAWLCPTKSVLLPLFRTAMGPAHLDVGVGTGYFPAASLRQGAPCTDLTLLDLNPNSLRVAERRVLSAAAPHQLRVKTVVASVTDTDTDKLLPLDPAAAAAKFDSISLFFLLHCLAGPPEAKTAVFDLLRPLLAPDGVLVGSTILGREQPANWFATKLMHKYNGKRKIFDNWDDSQAVFEQGLRRNFDDVESWVVGRVMLFRARKPRDADSSAKSP